MLKIFLVLVLFTNFQNGMTQGSDNTTSANYLRVALSGREDSDPSSSTRHAFRSADGEYLSVYEKGPVYPGAGVRQQYFFISEDYTVYDGTRERVIPFFDPEQWMNCDCDIPFPAELDIPHRFAIYHPVTVQAPLPNVPKDLFATKYTGFYYACPNHINPYEFSWFKTQNPYISPCKWIWYQSVQDATYPIRL